MKLIFIFLSISLNAQDFKNVIFIKNSAKNDENLKVSNAFANSLAYGFWINRNVNFNGTHSLVNPKISEDLPYQFLRILSLFDLYLTHSSLGFMSKDSEKIHNVLFSTIMEKNEISSYPPFSNNYSEAYEPILKALAPFTKEVELKSFHENEILYSEKGPKFSDSFSNKMKSKLKEKLALIWSRVRSFSDSGRIPLDVFNDALMPLNILGEIHLDSKGNNFFQIDLLLPGLVDVKKENRRGMLTANPLEWQLEPGISKKFFPPLVGLADRLEKMSYLKDAPEGTQWEEIKNKLIHIQIYKDLKNLDKMELTAEFGEVPEKNFSERKEEKNRLSLFQIDNTKRRSALKISGYIALPKGKILNKLMNEFKIEAYIHRLSFDLIRDGKFKNWKERFDSNSTFKMVSKPEKTFLSLRVLKGAKNLKETWPLKKLGFTCDKLREIYKKYKTLPLPNHDYTCFVDFSNVEEFKSDFIPKFAQKLMRKGIGAFATLELNAFLKKLQQMEKMDLSEEKRLFEKVFYLFKENQALLESLNFLPKEIINFTEK
jgi:hypothetical protein